jgi:hypothetical protein
MWFFVFNQGKAVAARKLADFLDEALSIGMHGGSRSYGEGESRHEESHTLYRIMAQAAEDEYSQVWYHSDGDINGSCCELSLC